MQKPSAVSALFWILSVIIIYGCVNSVNLTDGIDGLCSSVIQLNFNKVIGKADNSASDCKNKACYNKHIFSAVNHCRIIRFKASAMLLFLKRAEQCILRMYSLKFIKGGKVK
mgnify:CR=1 FL=1